MRRGSAPGSRFVASLAALDDEGGLRWVDDEGSRARSRPAACRPSASTFRALRDAPSPPRRGPPRPARARRRAGCRACAGRPARGAAGPAAHPRVRDRARGARAQDQRRRAVERHRDPAAEADGRPQLQPGPRTPAPAGGDGCQAARRQQPRVRGSAQRARRSDGAGRTRHASRCGPSRRSWTSTAPRRCGDPAHMPASPRWLVIVNPASGRPDGGAGWRAIEQALREAGIAFDSSTRSNRVTARNSHLRRCTTDVATSPRSAATAPSTRSCTA
jgi:hypothetical protein